MKLEDSNPCECITGYYRDDPIVVGNPEDCANGLAEVSATIVCTSEGIDFAMGLLPQDGVQGQVSWFKRFPVGTDPRDIKGLISNVDTGDGITCNYDNATLTIEPIIVRGCCSEEVILTTEVVELFGKTLPLAKGIGIKITELPYDQHEELISQLTELQDSSDRGLGDTANRLLMHSEDKAVRHKIRRWLKFYSCRRSEALAMTNIQFPNK
jgi:hypothetical protein